MQEATHISQRATGTPVFPGRLTESSDGYARIATAVGKTTADETDGTDTASVSHSRGARQARDMKSARNVANVMGNDMNSMDAMANATNDVARRRKYQPHARQRALVEPPAPPIELTPLVACSSADTAQDAVAYRGICAAIAQAAGRQSFGDAVMLEYLCAGRRARCSRSAADIAEIVGNERFRKRSAPSSQARHCRPACDWRASRRTADVRRRPGRSRP